MGASVVLRADLRGHVIQRRAEAFRLSLVEELLDEQIGGVAD